MIDKIIIFFILALTLGYLFWRGWRFLKMARSQNQSGPSPGESIKCGCASCPLADKCESVGKPESPGCASPRAGLK